MFIIAKSNRKSTVTVTGGTAAIAGSPYTTLTAAINAINSGGALTAPVVVNVPAGYTETLTGRITLTMTGTISNTIVIQKMDLAQIQYLHPMSEPFQHLLMRQTACLL